MDLSINVGGISFRNPVILASGTAGFGRELNEYIDFSKIGGISSKGLTCFPREGNPGCRVAETMGGMLNSVGLQNPGVDEFLRTELGYMQSLDTNVIVNVAGHSVDDYIEMVEKLDAASDRIDILELNLSCPNVKAGCMSIGTDTEQIYTLISNLRKRTKLPLWVKLTPNVTSISEMALAAENAGADAVVLINTLLAMRIDIRSKRPVLQNNTGGLSGPAVKPVAIRMVSECYRSVSIPIVGLGGIATAEDVLEFMIAGASAIQVGTSTLIHPGVSQAIAENLPACMKEYHVTSLKELTGSLRYYD